MAKLRGFGFKGRLYALDNLRTYLSRLFCTNARCQIKTFRILSRDLISKKHTRKPPVASKPTQSTVSNEPGYYIFGETLGGVIIIIVDYY
jgi:hypothetical protein